MKMIVTRREIRYGGKALRRGQVFEAKPEHVRVLKLLKKAADPPGAPVGHVVSTRGLFADHSVPEVSEPDAPGAEAEPKTYRTRRLKAEG